MVKNVLMVGVGGQGIIMASDALANVAARSGMDVKKSDVHGMAQRGGAVSSHVRFGEKVYSPLIPDGEADIIMSSELLEALRWIPFLKKGGRIVVNTQQIDPPDVFRGQAEYPGGILDELKLRDPNILSGDCLKMAMEAGNPRTSTVALLGMMSTLLDFKEKQWKDVLKDVVPAKVLDVNIKAFDMGRACF